MKKIKRFFSKLMSLFTAETAYKLIDILEFISPYVNKAYPVVKKIAELTPNRIDDEIIAAYDYFGFKDVFDPNIDKVIALRNLAKLVIMSEVLKENDEVLKDHMANTAIELAYAQYKQEETTS